MKRERDTERWRKGALYNGASIQNEFCRPHKLCDRIRTISPTQPNLAVAILLQAAPLLMSPFTA